MRILALLGLLALAACGADGAPMRPGASVGLGMDEDGVAFGGTVGATNGSVSVGIGL